MAGAPTVQSNDVRSILRWLTVPFNNYEEQCWLGKDRENKSYGFVTEQKSVLLCRTFLLRDFNLRCPMMARKTSNLFFVVYSSLTCRNIIFNYLDTLDNGHDHTLPASDPTGQVVVLWAARIAGTIYRESGRSERSTRKQGKISVRFAGQ